MPEEPETDSQVIEFLESCGLEMSSQKSDSKIIIGENVVFSPVDWTKVQESPVAFIKYSDFEKDIPKLVLRRFFGGEGALAVEENYEEILLSIGTFKVVDGRSLGSYADILANEAGAEGLSLAMIRNFSVQLFSFIDYFSQKELLEYPLDIDYGRSQDCFFIQAHCEDLGLYFENLLESSRESELKSPFVSMLKEMTEKTSLLEIYKLKGSQKFVLTAVWNILEEEKPQNSLIIHQIERFKEKDQKSVDFDVKTFFDTNTDRLNKIKAIEKTPSKFNPEEKNKELYNPALVKRVVKFLKTKDVFMEKLQTGLIDKDGLKAEINNFPDKEAIDKITEHDEDQILRILTEDDDDIEKQTEAIKEQISEDDYVEGILNSLNNMSEEEVKVAAGLEEDDEVQNVSGEREDLGEDSQRVEGSFDEDSDAITRVGGKIEEDSDVTKVKGSGSDEKESVTTIKGEKEDLKEETLRIKGSKESLDEKPWQVKRLAVAEKVKEELMVLKERGASKEEIDLKVKSIMMNELQLKEEEGDSFMSALSDDVTDDWVREGIDPINESIKAKVKLEKAQGQINSRDNQIKKMKSLIDNMKAELLKKQKQIEKIKETSSDVSGDESLVSPGADLRGLQRQSQELENKLSQSESEREKLRKRIEVETEKLTESHASGELSKKAKEDNEAKLRELQRAFDTLENDLSKKEEEKVRLQKKMELEHQKLKEDIKTAKRELDEQKTNEKSDFEADSLRGQNRSLEEQSNKLSHKIDAISQQKDDLDNKLKEAKQEILEKDNSAKFDKNQAKQSLLELEKEVTKIRNDLSRALSENELISKKFKEAQGEIGEMRAGSEEVANLSKENTNLRAQVESLKKRINFMYENTKSKNDNVMDAADVEKLIADKDAYKKQKDEMVKDFEKLREEKRELEQAARKDKAELDKLKLQANSQKKSPEDRQELIEKGKEVEKLKSELKQATDEIKALQLKQKSYEQKVKFMSVQIDKNSNKKAKVGATGGSANEAQLASKLKHAEKNAVRIKEAADKLSKELGEKKTELHKLKMEKKALENKVKELERKANLKKAA